jgi:hypothetical protein
MLRHLDRVFHSGQDKRNEGMGRPRERARDDGAVQRAEDAGRAGLTKKIWRHGLHGVITVLLIALTKASRTQSARLLIICFSPRECPGSYELRVESAACIIER